MNNINASIESFKVIALLLLIVVTYTLYGMWLNDHELVNGNTVMILVILSGILHAIGLAALTIPMYGFAVGVFCLSLIFNGFLIPLIAEEKDTMRNRGFQKRTSSLKITSIMIGTITSILLIAYSISLQPEPSG